MDLTILLIGIASLAVFIVPIYFLQRANKREEVNKQKKFKKFAEQNGVMVSKFDLWNENGIGLDQNKKKLFVSNKQNEKIVSSTIDLTDFALCKLVNDSRTVKTKHNKTTVVERITLNLKPANSTQTETAIVFYDKNGNTSLNNEFMLAESWEKLLNGILSR
jgi:hypothetical protein